MLSNAHLSLLFKLSISVSDTYNIPFVFVSSQVCESVEWNFEEVILSTELLYQAPRDYIEAK